MIQIYEICHANVELIIKKSKRISLSAFRMI